ncbi:hypothetical protein [Halomonas sp. S3-1-1]|uniref:hypothetical protein n=1 Tax=Halomonas sp. S3-1-1 TaxID=2912763 RepID=UPI002076952A|nr:hypothetical protein [Halomonas sp. S3-1-1]
MSTTKRAMHGRSPMVEAAVEAAAMVKAVAMVKAMAMVKAVAIVKTVTTQLSKNASKPLHRPTHD